MDDLEDLFEHAPCGYISADKDGRIGRANATLAGWIGVEPSDLAGKRFSDLLTIGGKIYYETHFAPLLRMQGHLNEVALDLSCADGQKLSVLVNAVERRNDADEPLFVRITIFNAGERRRYERSILEAKSAAEKSAAAEHASSELREQFIAVLGHDLRNPLAAMASGLRLLEREPVSERGQKIMGLMQGSISRATALIDTVMDFARARLGGGLGIESRPDIPIEQIIEQVVGELQTAAGAAAIEMELAIDTAVNGDPVRLGQLISNLLGNALTHGSPKQTILVKAATHNGSFELSVTNAGEAIPPEAMDRLFQPFFRGKVRPSQQGLGLGLHIASEIAKAHGGRLSVMSDASKTCFTLTMPCAPDGSIEPVPNWDISQNLGPRSDARLCRMASRS